MTKKIKIDYVEFPVKDINKVESFYGNTFGWTFLDYGQDYCAFSDGNMDGGFYTSQLSSKTSNGAVLIVLYSENLESTFDLVIKYGGVIVKEIFSFPGGRRFHFEDPSGNELAVWSDK